MYLHEVEFYNSPDGTVMVKEDGSPVQELLETDRHIIEKMMAAMTNLFPEAYSRLSDLYASSMRNKSFFEYKIVHRFARCNFGEYDLYHHDIDASGNFRFEEVKCPLRRECKHEGIVCKPQLNSNLTNRELEIFKLIGIGRQAPEIADKLIISVATVNRHRENIKTKLNLRIIGEMVNYYNTYLKHR